jgi:hypothetical protein
MEDSGYLNLAVRAAERLEALDKERSAIVESIGGHSDTSMILKEWAQVIYDRGQLRKQDDLRIEPTRFTEWKFTPTSSEYVYVDGLVHVIVHRNGGTHRAEVWVREYLKKEGGKVSRFVCPDDNTTHTSIFISSTNAPDKARQIINAALRDSWDYLQASLEEIWNEAVAYQVMREIQSNRIYVARSYINEFGEVK